MCGGCAIYANAWCAPTAVLSIAGQAVQLSGQGEIGSAVQVMPVELDFPPVTVGRPSNSMALTLTNVSSGSVAITGVTFSISDFTETDNCQGAVPANGSCAMQVTLTPQQLGGRNGYLTISFANNVLSQVITLTGTGITPLQVSPSSVDFGFNIDGTSSPAQAISIGNGMGPVPQPYAIAITGPLRHYSEPLSFQSDARVFWMRY